MRAGSRVVASGRFWQLRGAGSSGRCMRRLAATLNAWSARDETPSKTSNHAPADGPEAPSTAAAVTGCSDDIYSLARCVLTLVVYAFWVVPARPSRRPCHLSPDGPRPPARRPCAASAAWMALRRPGQRRHTPTMLVSPRSRAVARMPPSHAESRAPGPRATALPKPKPPSETFMNNCALGTEVTWRRVHTKSTTPSSTCVAHVSGSGSAR